MESNDLTKSSRPLTTTDAIPSSSAAAEPAAGAPQPGKPGVDLEVLEHSRSDPMVGTNACNKHIDAVLSVRHTLLHIRCFIKQISN